MARRVFLYQGRGPTPSEAADIVRRRTDAKVVDQYGDNLVIEAEQIPLRAIARRLAGWLSSPTRRVGHPRIRA